MTMLVALLYIVYICGIAYAGNYVKTRGLAGIE